MSTSVHLAIDLGAESGRAMVGVLADERLTLHEVHRFTHGPVEKDGGLFWDLEGLWREIRHGLGAAATWCRGRGLWLDSVGVDTWGVDFALVGASGELLGAPRCYRDPRNIAVMRRMTAGDGGKAIYDATGIQLMALNTLFQLGAMREHEPEMIARARRLLFMPDLFHFMLTGEMTNEETIASTSQMYDPRAGAWSRAVAGGLGFAEGVLGAIVSPGTRVGMVKADLLAECGAMRPILVIAPGGHDTASAIAAVPVVEGSDWAYLSSGTWSLLGVELDAPIINDAVRAVPFTNEVGVGGKIRFLKNIAGLWLVQECKRDLDRMGVHADYPELTALAGAAEAFGTLIDPDWGPLGIPGGMLAKIRRFAAATGQPEPRTPGEFVRCCLESLACAYRRVLGFLRVQTGRRIDVLHVIGGGSKNELLNQMTADACGVPLIVGPVEATATGNILVQAMGMGLVGGIGDIRRISGVSVVTTSVKPGDHESWYSASARFESLITKAKDIDP
ncbi:MAG: rhamnulokinase family protein [Planctomycetota bacterium]